MDTPKTPANSNIPAASSPQKAEPRAPDADRGQPEAGRHPRDQSGRQNSDRQRTAPQDQPPADVLDDANIAGDKDFELQPPTKSG